MRGSLDTSAVLRFLVRDDVAQANMVGELLGTSKAQVMVADVAIVEIVHVLTRYYQLERDDAIALVTGFINLPIINCNRGLFDRAFEAYATHPALSFEDCYLAMDAELNDALPLYAFDKKLARQFSQAELIGVA